MLPSVGSIDRRQTLARRSLPAFPSSFLGFVRHRWASHRDRVAAGVEIASTPEDLIDDVCEHETVKLSLTNLRTFPWIAEAEAEGRLRLHGLRFGIADGLLEQLGPDGTFSPV